MYESCTAIMIEMNQHLADTGVYLDAIGRQQTALVLLSTAIFITSLVLIFSSYLRR